jgi:hypothetical protein
MTTTFQSPEGSITTDIIRRVHLTLADMKTGEEVLAFLKSTEPVFMDEVNRFIRTEVSRMRYQMSEPQIMYFGSIIGASYIAGFLIAREAAHNMFDGTFSFRSDIKDALTPDDYDKIIDKNRKEGKSYQEIAKTIEKMLLGDPKPIVEKKPIIPVKPPKGKRLDLGELT